MVLCLHDRARSGDGAKDVKSWSENAKLFLSIIHHQPKGTDKPPGVGGQVFLEMHPQTLVDTPQYIMGDWTYTVQDPSSIALFLFIWPRASLVGIGHRNEMESPEINVAPV